MGLFTKSKTQVGTSVSRVMEDSLLPNSIISGALKAQIEGDGQMIEHAVEELSGGLGVRMHAYYRYGRDKYVNGLPSGTSLLNIKGRDTIKAAIQAEVGGTVTLQYYQVGALNLLHLGWFLLNRDYGYNSLDNSFTVGGRKVYLTNIQPVVTDATQAELESGALDRLGTSPLAGVTPARPYPSPKDEDPNVFIIDATASTDTLKVTYAYELDKTKVVEGVTVAYKEVTEAQFSMSMAGWDMAATYHQACYSRAGVTRYWIYKVGANTNAAVEAVFATAPTTTGTFFPFAYCRLNKTAITKNNNPTEYSSTKKLMKYLNIDYDQVADGINGNPDIADVEQAFLTMAVPAVTKDESERRYLFDFFGNLHTSAMQSQAASGSLEEYNLNVKLTSRTAATAIVIQDKKFKMVLSWDTIVRRRVAGKVADVGKHDSGTNFNVDEKQAVTIFGVKLRWSPETPTHTYRRQLNADMYEEIAVLGLSMKYYIFNEYTTTGDEENEDILMIPLDYAITSLYNIPDRELLYARSLHFVFNSRVVTKLKWYQQGWFKVVLVIVAIVVTILSYGKTFQAIGAALSVGAVGTAIMLLIPILVQYLVISVLVRKVVKAIGGKLALIIAVIATIAGMTQIITNGGLANAPWAKELLAVATNLGNGAAKQFQEDYRGVIGEYASFQDYVKEQEDKVKTANELLNSNVHLVPLVVFGESPDDFYQRTVHSGNIGVLGIDVVSSYVDAALTLPKLSETIGEVYV